MTEDSSENHVGHSKTISVVIPTYNSESVIGDCLKSIIEQSLAPYEIIVSDGGSADRTVEIARGFGATVIQMDSNRSAQRNAAAARSSGKYVFFVDSDMRLSQDVLSECIQCMSADIAALVIPEVFVGEGYWASVRGFERSFYDNVWYLEAARFYNRDQFLTIGGFDARMVGPEDWDLDQRIRVFGMVGQIKARIYHYEGQINLRKLLRKKAHYSNSFSLFRKVHPERAALCLSPGNRVRLILFRPKRILRHPLLAFGMATLGLGEILVSRNIIGSRLKLSYSHEKPLGY